MSADYREEEFVLPVRCPNCGGLNPAENKVCQFCNAKLAGAQAVRPADLNPLTDEVPATTQITDAPYTLQPVPPTVAVEPPFAAPPSPPRRTSGGLSSRLGGAEDSGSGSDWLGSLRRSIGGEEPTPPPSTPARSSSGSFASEPPPPTTPSGHLGYVLPPTPDTSPYRRNDGGGPTDETVDWLASLRASASPPPDDELGADEEEAAPLPVNPDWLSKLRSDAPTPAAETPAWLRDEPPAETPAWQRERPTPPPPAPATDLPPWLADSSNALDGQGGEQHEEGPATSPSVPPPSPPPETDFNNWFSNRTAPSSEAQAEPAASANSGFFSDSDAPAWLRDVAAAPPPPMPRAAQPEVQLEPEPSPEPPLSAAPPASELEPMAVDYIPSPPAENGASAAAPLVAQADEGEATPTPPRKAGDTGPLYAEDVPSDVVSETPVAEPPRKNVSGGLIKEEDLPAWLRAQVSSDAETAPVEAATTPDSGGADRFFPNAGDSSVPSWLRGIGQGPEDATPAAAEALTAQMAEPIQRTQRVMTVRGARPGAAEALAALAAAPSSATRTSSLQLNDERGYRARAMNWLANERVVYLFTALIMLAVIIADVYFNQRPLGTVAPPLPITQVDNFYKTINSLPPGAAVLVAYDWDADRAAEMEPLARAVTCHLGAINARFATLSLVPAGPAFAQRVAGATVDGSSKLCVSSPYKYGSDYVNLGYTPGGDFALRSAVSDLGLVFSKDYRQGDTLFSSVNGKTQGAIPALKGIGSLRDFRLLIVLEGDESTARSWIEQVASQPNVPPILLGTSATLDPSLQPYIAAAAGTTRFVGKVAGPTDTNRYRYDLGQRGMDTGELERNLNALSFAHLFIALLIIFGNLLLLTRIINKRR